MKKPDDKGMQQTVGALVTRTVPLAAGPQRYPASRDLVIVREE